MKKRFGLPSANRDTEENNLNVITYILRNSRRADDRRFLLWCHYLVLLMLLWGDAGWETQRLCPLD